VPFQLPASSARKVSNAAATPAGERSLTTATSLSADNRFQSCRSFFRVDPERFTPTAWLTTGRAKRLTSTASPPFSINAALSAA
jgi:hypothetical protein